MNKEPLLIFVIYYSLFHKKLFENEKDIINSLPDNAFGIFCSIRRNQILNNWPTDIHGCIGYWNNDFNILNKKDLFENLLRVSYDAMWSDHRKNYFKPIQTDSNSFLELDFMMNPIYKINKKTGIIDELKTEFTNQIFGIIIQTTNGHYKATYLPNVFPNITFKEIVLSIKQKAGIQTDDFELFAYKIIQIKSQIINLLKNNILSYTTLYKFSRLLIDNINKEAKYLIPYSCHNDVLEWNDNDEVRNIATLSEIFRYIHLYPNIASKEELNIIHKKINDILKNINEYSSQSLSFLGFKYSIDNKSTNGKSTNSKSKYCQKLLNDLDEAESEFEKPEIIIGLNQANCALSSNKYINELTYNLSDSIFRMNWTIQAIYSFNKKPSIKLIEILEKKIDELINNIDNIETNYLAVSFEALSYIYSSINNSNKKLEKRILDKIFILLFELEKRKNCDNTFYAFLNGLSRIDISGHINNGFYIMNKNIHHRNIH